MRIATALIAVATFCLSFSLSACDKPASTGGAGTALQADSTSQNHASGSGTEQASGAATGGQQAASPAPSGAGTKSAPVTAVDLSGKWLALFGRTEGGGTLDEAWKSGEIIEFKKDGGILWTKKTGSAPLDYSFELSGLAMTLKPGDAQNIGRDDEVGLMNVGRDDEVGMLNVGRDDEVGLLDKKQGSKETIGQGVLKKTLFRDGSFLAVMGEQNDIMVYGKIDGNDPARPEVLGNYTGNIASSGLVPVKFEWKENYLLGTFENMQGIFKGQYASGYFVGVTSGAAGSGLAAVTKLPNGELDGIFLPMPFNSMNANFDFAPGQ